MDKTLTISIAAYNVEKYIGKALESIVNSGCIGDLEVFVIDDGGIDGTLKIAQEYQKKFPLSIKSVHKENGGYGSTVNYSIQHATGKYFKLLDGDDWFDAKELYELVNELKKSEEDLIIGKFKRVFEIDGSEELRDQSKGISNKVGLFEDLSTKDWFTNAAIVYRTALLKESGCLLTEKCFYTDQEYDLLPLKIVKTYKVSSSCAYCYRIGREGQSVSVIGIQKHYADQFIVLDRLLSVYREEVDHPDGYKQMYIFTYIVRRVMNQIFNLLLLPTCKKYQMELKGYINKIQNDYPKIYSELLHSKVIKYLALGKSNYVFYYIAHKISQKKHIY